MLTPHLGNWEKNTRFCVKNLVLHRNPGPVGQVRVQWLCHLNDPSVTTEAELSPQPGQGVTNESFSKTITNHLVLPISHCMGSQVPVQNPYRQSGGGSWKLCQGIFPTTGLRGDGIECPSGSCASPGVGPAEGLDFRLCWNAEGQNSHSGVQPISEIERKTLLGLISGLEATA